MLIRYSMLQSFLDCPLGFKRRYIDKIEDTEKSSALEYGQAVHAAIRSHFEGGDGIEVFRIYWDSLKDTEMKYYRHGWAELRNLAMTQFLPNFFRLHAKHYAVTCMEETHTMEFCGHTVQGTWDMVSEYDGVLSVSDWKTASAPYKSDKILKSPQMWLYAMLYRDKYGKLPQQLIYKVFNKGSGSIQTLKTEVTEEKLENHKESVCNVIKTMAHCIENNNWFHRFDCFCDLEEGK